MSSTDTNQASENALKEITKILLMYKAGLAYEHVEPQYEWLGSIDIEEAKLDLLAIIRTEKLKLLAEVRERVIGESFKPSGFDERYSRQEGDNGHITHYETKKDAETINQHQEYQRTELTKLETEL